jgi:glycerol-3-phosphate acyltransferase PlsX
LARIALDAMGGDFAPRANVAGALQSLAELDTAHTIQLVGRTAIIEAELRELLDGEYAGQSTRGVRRDRIEIIEAPDVIEMAEKPGAAVRGKPNSSMILGLRLQADGRSDAFVSAGNTGAQMAASMLILKLHAGLDRPAIATTFPTARRAVVVLDSGANVDCSAEELVQFARLGAVYAEDILGRTNPAVGLLSIGEEPEKGNGSVKEAHELLRRETTINFVGNVEGRDLPAGACDRGPIDVVVCDGFVGNVVLKFYEGVAPMIVGFLQKAGIEPQRISGALKDLDYSEHGGAPLLGVRGVSIISHGKSSPRAIKNAVKVAVRAVESRMNEHIGRRLERHEGEGEAA